MSAVSTILTTVVATAGAVALYRFVKSKRDELENFFTARPQAEGGAEPVIDYEQDPETGVYRPKP
ncbi:MAG: hypothetical protein AAGB02_01985 [Pseudomonadota bacterium]